MDAAVRELRAEGYEVRTEDVARLSPLGHKHVEHARPLSLTLPEAVARGELRPLRDPRTARAGRAGRARACVGFLLRWYSDPQSANATEL